MRKDFHLLNELNNFIFHASEYGLISKWLMVYRSLTEEKPNYRFITFQFEALAVTNVIYLSINLLALIVTVTEIIVHKKIRTKSMIRFWKLLEMLIEIQIIQIDIFYLKINHSYFQLINVLREILSNYMENMEFNTEK